jgi:DNA-binding MarR family transcriptional regulator
LKVRNEVNFAIVPEWVLDADISAQAVRLYGVLNRHASNHTSRCRVRRKKLAERMKVSEKTVDRALDDLERIGAIEVAAHYNDNGQAANEYLVRQTPKKPAVQMGIPLDTGGEGDGDTDGEGPLDADVAQNESLNELEPPIPPAERGADERTPRAQGNSPRQRAWKDERRRLIEAMEDCEVPTCNGETAFCDRCDRNRRRVSELTNRIGDLAGAVT